MITTRWIDVPASADGRAARLAVHLAGQGPLALLVHGYPLDHRLWLDTLHGPLAARRTLAAIDLRGHGASPGSGDAVHTMALFARDLAAVVRSLADGPVDVVGLSLGGYAAFALHALAPELVGSLVLTNTRAVADDDAAKAGRAAAITTVLEHGPRAIAAAMLPKLLAPGADALQRARVQDMITATPVATIVADLRGLAERPDRRSALPQLAVPTLVVAGEHDPIATPTESAAMAAAIPAARCEVLPGTAHLAPLEAPERFAAAVGAFWHG